MKESRFENILHARRKTETQQFNTLGDMSTQDCVSVGMDRSKAVFLREIMGGMKKGCETFNRARVE